MKPELDITIIIPTYNRAESLAETLACIQRVDSSGIQFAVAVVENGVRDETEKVVGRFSSSLPVSYHYEPKPGKSHALNRGIREAPPGSIIVVLDDDMSPHPEWLQGVWSICQRWPDHGYFSGLSYIIWPDVSVPEWARIARISGWAFSVNGTGLKKDKQEVSGDFVAGNHFWFRSNVLKDVPAFKTRWLTEISFMFDLQRCGYKGVTGIDAVTGHRIQPHLLQPDLLRKRIVDLSEIPELKMRYPDLTRPGKLWRKRPLVFLIACYSSLWYWRLAYARATCRLSATKRIAGQLRALAILSDRKGMLRYRNIGESP